MFSHLPDFLRVVFACCQAAEQKTLEEDNWVHGMMWTTRYPTAGGKPSGVDRTRTRFDLATSPPLAIALCKLMDLYTNTKARWLPPDAASTPSVAASMVPPPHPMILRLQHLYASALEERSDLNAPFADKLSTEDAKLFNEVCDFFLVGSGNLQKLLLPMSALFAGEQTASPYEDALKARADDFGVRT